MNLTKLFETQKLLDERIVKEKGLEGIDLLPRKILALQVELGELANELPTVFKFWSDKKNNYEKALEEYVDGIHFFLSLANDLGMLSVDVKPSNVKNAEKLFALINRYVAEMWWSHHDIKMDVHVKWIGAISHYLSLGRYLGFTWHQIEQAYYEKNKINHERQNGGY